jgi:hypothetical protein
MLYISSEKSHTYLKYHCGTAGSGMTSSVQNMKTDERNPVLQKMYKDVPENELPLGESLKDTIARLYS